ncbi:hypothetical protein A9977_16085 [Variovorax sp. UMC13]|nr:hypothetical protein [Variovorax sp. UMC13]
MRRRNWKLMQPNSLRHALELCKDHALEKLNRSVPGIASEMGLADHWSLYKWLQNGRMPLCFLIPYENACGIDFVSRWLASSKGRVLIDMPTGRNLRETDVVELHNGFGQALQLLTSFFKGDAKPEDTTAALTAHLAQVAWHRANVEKHTTPELDFGQ